MSPIAARFVPVKIVVLWAFALIWMSLFAGCEKRRPVEPTPQMELDRKFWVKVLLFENVIDCTLSIPSSFSVVDGRTKAVLSVVDNSSESQRLCISGGRVGIGKLVFTAGDGIDIVADAPFVFSVNSESFRGILKVIPNANGVSADLVNEVPMESYLAGVVGAEMPGYWEKEALKAQAVAARTYGLYIKSRFGQYHSWDIRRTQANQVYRGISAESMSVWDAVKQTTGQVLVCETEASKEEIFPAYYCSVCGGHTENSKFVFGDDFRPLGGVACPYCIKVAKTDIFLWPTVILNEKQVTQRLAARYPLIASLGRIKAVEPTRESSYKKLSRITMLKVVGETGKSEFIRGEDFRLCLDSSGMKIKSCSHKISKVGEDWLFFAGKGFGHGVGMCQYGAEAMAREGANYRKILGYYYPGSEMIKKF